MLIHRCAGCGKLVIDRVAADDDAERLFALFERSPSLGPELGECLRADGVAPLVAADRELLRRRLYGGLPETS